MSRAKKAAPVPRGRNPGALARPARLAREGRESTGVKTNAEYSALARALAGGLSKKPRAWLAMRLAIELVTEEIRKDHETERGPLIEAERARREDVRQKLNRLFDSVLSSVEHDIGATVLGKKRMKQASAWGSKGGATRKKYSDADRARWKKMAAAPGMKHHTSKSRKAEIIASKGGLPISAIETIRRVI